MLKKIKNLQKLSLLKIFRLERFEKHLILVILIAIFLISNFLISLVSIRLDFSFGRAYTLSSATKKIIKNLDDLVNIKFFVSSDLPTRLLPVKTEVVDFLNEYKKESRGKIIVKILDPKKDQQAKNQALELGVPELQFSQLERDKYQVSASYFGIVLTYGEKREILPQVTDLSSLEYNLTAAIYKMTKKEAITIGILGKENIFNPQEDDLSTLKKTLQQQFALDFLDVSANSATKEIDQSYKSILVFDDNKKEFDNQEVDAIKNYLNKGGKAIFFVDGVWVLDNLQTTEAKHNLFSLIDEYGINLNKNLVLSTSAEMVNFGNQLVQFITPYPFWMRTNNFNEKTAYFSNINQLLFPWASSLSLNKKADFQMEELIKTSRKSWEQKENFVLDPQNIPQPQAKDLKEFLLVAQSKNKNNGEIVVIPSSRFVIERYQSRTADNLEFVLNVLNNLASGGALAGIRQRAVSFYPLPDLAENQKDLFKYINIFLLPSLLAIFGTVKLLRRR